MHNININLNKILKEVLMFANKRDLPWEIRLLRFCAGVGIVFVIFAFSFCLASYGLHMLGFEL